MTIKELLGMKMHEEYGINHRIVIRVPGGWIYDTKIYKNGVYTGGMTSCFVPEPNLQTTMPIDNGYDEWLDTIEPDMPEPDCDKTAQSEKNFLTMGRWN